MRRLLILLLWLPLTAAAQSPLILILGDSLSAGYGISTRAGWVSLLEERLQRQDLPYRVLNASVSGETSAGGLTRLPDLLAEHRPEVLVIELGANDGLRGTPFAVLRRNLKTLVRLGRDGGARVMLIGVRLPPNYGAAYTRGFQAVFREVAEEEGVPLVPALLKDVGEHLELMQADGLHPTEAAQGQILDNVWPTLEPLLGAAVVAP